MSKNHKAKKEKTADEPEQKLKRKAYERELARLQVELVKLQEWIRAQGAESGGDLRGARCRRERRRDQTHHRTAEPARVPGRGAGCPTEREKTQWYFQRYVPHLPAAGEMVLFDRSWYNRAGVERVMGFCTKRNSRSFSTPARNSSGC